MTTPLLERAFAEAAKLPEREQESLASLMLEEMQAEKKWDEAFAGSQDLLAQTADEALAEHCERKTRIILACSSSKCTT